MSGGEESRPKKITKGRVTDGQRRKIREGSTPSDMTPAQIAAERERLGNEYDKRIRTLERRIIALSAQGRSVEVQKKELEVLKDLRSKLWRW